MNNDISIVTGFFDIKRGEWSSFSIDNERYFQNFKKWACIRNELIVFVDNEALSKLIMEYRISLGLEKSTKIVVIDNFFELDSELYNSLKRVSKNDVSKLYRYRHSNPEVWNADYNYVMMLKFWCVKKAIVDGLVSSEIVSWIDFGYAHGDLKKLGIKDSYDYCWKYEFPQKICLFSIKDLDERPIFDIILLLDTYLQGSPFLGPKNMMVKLCDDIRTNMVNLNNIGLMDDDQSMLLLCLRQKPDNFAVFKSEWCTVLRDYNDCVKNHESYSPKKTHLVRRIYRWLRKLYLDKKYVRKLYKYVRKQKAS